MFEVFLLKNFFGFQSIAIWKFIMDFLIRRFLINYTTLPVVCDIIFVI